MRTVLAGSQKVLDASMAGPGESLSRDYVVVARLHDNVTGEPVIILAGILGKEPKLQARSSPIKRTWMQCCKKLRRTGTN